MGANPLEWRRGRVFRLATRGSPLARWQADHVASLLRAAHPGLRVELVVVRTRGDLLAGARLEEIGGQGVFAKEVQQAVLARHADAAVHSAKDLPSVTPDGLRLAAVPPRGDPRDALAGLPLAGLPPGATVATGSVRRRAQLANLRPDLSFAELRGNIGRRLERLSDGSIHAVVVAKAALDRLGWTGRATDVLPPVVMLPQVGQGALAVECRADDEVALGALAAVDDQVSHRSLDAERALLRSLAGSCAVPMAGLASPVGGRTGGSARLLRLDGMLASGDGRVLVRASLLGEEPDELGAALADYLLHDCGGESIEGWGTAPAAEGARAVAAGAAAAAAGAGVLGTGVLDAPGR